MSSNANATSKFSDQTYCRFFWKPIFAITVVYIDLKEN